MIFKNVLLVTLVVILLLKFNSGVAQTLEFDRENNLIESPKKGLLPIPLPQLKRLDQQVAEQIISFQQSFIDLLARADASDAELVNGYGMLGQLYHAYEMFGSAENCYLNSIHLTPEEYSWYHLLASVYQKVGRLSEAAQNYKSVREIQPDYVASAANLGFIYIQLNQLDDARKEFQSALRLSPDSPAAHYGLGQIALSEKNYPEAIKRFQTALEHVPAANRVHYSLAMAYRGIGDLEKAKSHLTQQGIVGIRPIDPLVDSLKSLIQGERVHFIKGRMAFSAGRFKEAADLFAKAVKARPQSVRARVNLGVSLAKIEDVDAAIAEFRSAINYDSKNPNAHFNLGVQLFNRKEYLHAIEHFETVLRINPEDISSAHQLARAFVKIGSEDKALARLLSIRELAAENEPIVLLMSRLLIHFERYHDALSLLSKANTDYPERGLTAHELARLLAACPDTSLRDGQRAVDLALRVFQSQKTPIHAETLALALAESGRCEEAANVQRQLIAIYEKSNNDKTLLQYKNDLSYYEKGSPCRPVSTP